MRSSFLVLSILSLSGLVGCSVYKASFLDAGGDSGQLGCRRGTADCDRNGSCESDLDSPLTCGSCENRCLGAQTCNPSTLTCEGDAGMFDAAMPDSAVADGGSDAGVDSGPVICGNVPPPRPTVEDSIDVETHTWALKDVVLDQRGDRWQEIGWNLDERCTFSIDDEHLCTPPTAPVPPLDGPGGVDNSFGQHLLGLIAMFNSTFQAVARDSMERGQSIVVRLKDWNGMDDDPSVELVLAAAAGVQRFDGLTEPQWDGNDRWDVADSSFSGGNPDRPLIRDDNAYVAGRMIVARIPDRQPIVIPWVGTNSFALRLTDALFTAEITPDGNNLQRAWITGRYGVIDLADAWESAGLCDGGALRSLIDMEVSEDMDVRSTPGTGGPGATCDALSVALEFTGYRGEFGTVVPTPPPPPVECIPDP